MIILHKMIWCDSGLFPYYYGFCPSERVWDRQMKKFSLRSPYGVKPSGALTSFFDNPKGQAVAIVSVGHECRPKSAVNLLVHEAVHVWRGMREDVGEHKPSEEVEAYYIQDIFVKLTMAYEKTRGPLIRA